MWANALKILKRLKKALPISSIYIIGSFATQKRRPADIDFVIMLNTKSKNRKEKWSFDLLLGPDNDYGKLQLEDYRLWMKQKYGAKKSAVIKIQ
mgnify:CR=1 FL=1